MALVVGVGAVALLYNSRDDARPDGVGATVSTIAGPVALPPLPSLDESAPVTLATPGPIPEAGRNPVDLGVDPALDQLARSCYDGSMGDCDKLFAGAPAGSDYQRYGDSCAERQPTGTQELCTVTFPS